MLFRGIHPSEPSKASVVTVVIGFFLMGAAFYGFIELAEDVMEDEKFAVDQAVSNLTAALSTPGLDQFMGTVTELGSVWWITVGSAVTLVYLAFFSKTSRWLWVFFLVNMIGISALTKGLKLLFERQRPEVLEQYDGVGYSFPSGHSSGAMAFYGFLIYLVVISPLHKKWKWAINSLLTALIILIAASRTFIGVHYFTDIAAGIALGLGWLLICIASLEMMMWRRRRNDRSSERQTMSS
ncbi:phosphatase PAP2 family protein [Halobacillus litoralis]|uniref:phosphatase PAP2 family protein n=1 Tax=Halobacillus litoralis TaxID=45668 RepID=UPI001CD78E5C|nr:phosphatase PAP2 family protein [Halobacillus litoralis]MCA1022361.1 phosphatase PAP2 family protein [Halobacillus litoralis]